MKALLNPLSFLGQQIQETFRKGTRNEKILFATYVVAGIGLFLYSYTQIDLGLVITRIPSLYTIEKQFQYIGYFNRPLSAFLFIFLAIIFIALYSLLLLFVRQKKIRGYTVWSIIGIVTVILTFSYNAFSYDLFNYIFDARIVTHYHQNPYLHKALDFPSDPMLGFMHWTDRTYPYGPLWLAVTVPISFIGTNIFIITFFLFKIFISICFLSASYFLYQMLQKISEEKALENLVLFALNPLILFECLVSAHNDIVMMAFSLAALFYLSQKKYWLSLLLLFASIGIKFATFALLPVLLVAFWHQRNKQSINNEIIYQLCFAFMLFPLLIVTNRTIFQPWYLLYVMPFLPFVTQRFVRFIFIFISVAAIFLYTPFLATGDWHSIWYTFPEKIVYWFVFAGVIVSGIYLLWLIYKLIPIRFRLLYNKQHA